MNDNDKPTLIHNQNALVTGEHILMIETTPAEGQAIAYAELIGEGDYESAERLAKQFPHVLDPYTSHDEWVKDHQRRKPDDLPTCGKCGHAIYQQSKHAKPGYHRRCSPLTD